MHIVDGVLSPEVLATGGVLTLGGVALGLKQLPTDKLPQTALLSAVFFVASLIHIPFGVTSVHFIGNGLMGLALGWSVFPALCIALFLQALFFGFGGVLVLGINTLNVALPAVMVFYLLRTFLKPDAVKYSFGLGALAGGLAIGLSATMVALSLALSGEAFVEGAKLSLISHVPLILVEGLLTGSAVHLLIKVKPDFFMHTLPSNQQVKVQTA